MVSISAAEFKAIINDSVITATNAEYILDNAIDELNTYDADIHNMSGTAGSKTWSGESKQKGAIYELAHAKYKAYYKGVLPVSALGLSVTPSNLSNQAIADLAEKLAKQLKEMEVDVG